jgi:hypothetical protein
VSEALKQRGLSISPAGMRRVWQRHDLTAMRHRSKALEAKVAQAGDGILLTEAQIAALEKAKADKEAHGEFDSNSGDRAGADTRSRPRQYPFRLGRGTRVPTAALLSPPWSDPGDRV